MIHIELLRESDKGKSVTYSPFEFSIPDKGVITNWDEKFIYIKFENTVKSFPVNPEDLEYENYKI